MDKSSSEKEAFIKIENSTFGLAITALKAGKRAYRASWKNNDTLPWIVYMSELNLPPYDTQGTERKVNDRTARWIGKDKPLNSKAYIAFWDGNTYWQPGWTPSQEDMLAEDWHIID